MVQLSLHVHPQANDFMSLFEGFKGAHGTYQLTGETKDSGKVIGRAVSLAKEVTVELHDAHLMGKQGLGIIPINEQSMAKFGAIDVDEYPLNLAHLAQEIARHKLPLVVCRTKSGGAHLYMFTTEFIEASMMQAKLRQMAALLGYGGCEIFPRQAQILVERGDSGNWINLPYFDAAKTMRYALGDNFKSLKIEEFIKYAHSRAISKEALTKIKLSLPEILPGGPPCLQQLAQQGFPEGSRNNGLFNMGVYARKAYGENWQRHVEEYNSKHFNPPLTPTEVLGVIKSVTRKDYGYTCKAQPIQSFCNAAVCRTCKFGVGGADLGMPKMGTLTKVCTVPPIWFLDVEVENGSRRLELTTEDLQQPLLFQRRCMEMLSLMPIILKRENWQQIVMKLLMDVNIVEVPPEVTPVGQLMQALEAFVTSRVTARKAEEIIMGKPWINNNEVHFRFADFMEYLTRRKFTALPTNRIAMHIQEMPGYRKAFHNIKGKGANCHVLPMKHFSQQTEGFDTPPQPEDQI